MHIKTSKITLSKLQQISSKKTQLNIAWTIERCVQTLSIGDLWKSLRLLQHDGAHFFSSKQCLTIIYIGLKPDIFSGTDVNITSTISFFFK